MRTGNFFRSVTHAWNGIMICYRTERNFRTQLLITACVLVASVLFPLRSSERVMILFVVMTVLVLELLNSSVERVADLVKPRLSEHVAEIKDLMAGAVLIASLFALFIGMFIFLPHVFLLLGSL